MKKNWKQGSEAFGNGLHSRTRYVIYPQGNDRTEQMRDIICLYHNNEEHIYVFSTIIYIVEL